MSTRRERDDAIFGGANEVTIAAGTLRAGERSVSIELERRTGLVERVERPYPQHGFGGAELVVSPDERWAALFVYSGQSEQGWELFELAPTLRHASSLPYVHGKGMAPAFSPDSRYLAMAVTSGWRERGGAGRDLEELLEPTAGADEKVLVDWAVLYWHCIAAKEPKQVAIGTWIPRSIAADDLVEWRLDERLQFVATDRLVLKLPWGEDLEIALPVDGPITTGSPGQERGGATGVTRT